MSGFPSIALKYVILLLDTDIFYIQMFAMVISTYSAALL